MPGQLNAVGWPSWGGQVFIPSILHHQSRQLEPSLRSHPSSRSAPYGNLGRRYQSQANNNSRRCSFSSELRNDGDYDGSRCGALLLSCLQQW